MVYALDTTPIKNGLGNSQDRVVLFDSGANTRIPLVALPEGDIKANQWRYPAAAGGISNTTTAVLIAAAAGVGLRNYIMALQISADPLTNATEFVIRDGAGGTVLWRMKIGTAGLPLMPIPLLIPLKGTANTLLEAATLTASGAGAVFVNAQGLVAA